MGHIQYVLLALVLFLVCARARARFKLIPEYWRCIHVYPRVCRLRHPSVKRKKFSYCCFGSRKKKTIDQQRKLNIMCFLCVLIILKISERKSRHILTLTTTCCDFRWTWRHRQDQGWTGNDGDERRVSPTRSGRGRETAENENGKDNVYVEWAACENMTTTGGV